jgi:dihydropteroate synthase
MDKTAGLDHERRDCRRGFPFALKRRPLVVGVLNVTPDSFSDGGAHFRKDEAYRRSMEMAEDGADIIDIGGESTRPGAKPVSAEEESARILPVIQALVGKVPVPMSVDTRRAAVARAALDAGCRMVNDVSACADDGMPEVIREYGVPIVLMHMKGDPETMQVAPHYEDVVSEVRSFLAARIERLGERGVARDMIAVDPGIGFGKRFRDNLDLLRSIGSIGELGHPVMVGGSRKRFLGELLKSEANNRLGGSLAVAAWCFKNRVDMVRVHDVKETADLFRVMDAIEHPEDYPAAW